MCDSCGKNPTPEQIGEELSSMEEDFLGGKNGAIRIKKILTGISRSHLAVAQEIEVNTITEEGVTQEVKTAVVYLTPDIIMEMVDFIAGEDDSSG